MKTNIKDILMVGITLIITLSIVGLTGYSMYVADEPTSSLLVGAIISGFATVIGYYFGSSQGSKDKNNLLKPKNK